MRDEASAIEMLAILKTFLSSANNIIMVVVNFDFKRFKMEWKFWLVNMVLVATKNILVNWNKTLFHQQDHIWFYWTFDQIYCLLFLDKIFTCSRNDCLTKDLGLVDWSRTNSVFSYFFLFCSKNFSAFCGIATLDQ